MKKWIVICTMFSCFSVQAQDWSNNWIKSEAGVDIDRVTHQDDHHGEFFVQKTGNRQKTTLKTKVSTLSSTYTVSKDGPLQRFRIVIKFKEPHFSEKGFVETFYWTEDRMSAFPMIQDFQDFVIVSVEDVTDLMEYQE